LGKGKDSDDVTAMNIQQVVHELRTSWPQLVPNDLKERIVRMFREETSSESLAEFVCASCAENHLVAEEIQVFVHEMDLAVLERPDVRLKRADPSLGVFDVSWLQGSAYDPEIVIDNMPNVMLENEG
jgi:hypothetical protein